MRLVQSLHWLGLGITSFINFVILCMDLLSYLVGEENERLFELLNCVGLVSFFSVSVDHVVLKSSLYTPSSVVHTANIEIKLCDKWSLTRMLKTMPNYYTIALKVVALAHEMFQLQGFDWESFCVVLYKKSPTRGCRTWRLGCFNDAVLI